MKSKFGRGAPGSGGRGGGTGGAGAGGAGGGGGNVDAPLVQFALVVALPATPLFKRHALGAFAILRVKCVQLGSRRVHAAQQSSKDRVLTDFSVLPSKHALGTLCSAHVGRGGTACRPRDA